MLDFAPTTPNLQYYAPEVGRLLSPDTVCANPAKTKEGDVFSFGTLIYLLFIGRLPFEDLETRELLVAVSSGQFSSLLLSLNSNLALIIRLDQGELEGGRNRVYSTESVRLTFTNAWNQFACIGLAITQTNTALYYGRFLPCYNSPLVG